MGLISIRGPTELTLKYCSVNERFDNNMPLNSYPNLNGQYKRILFEVQLGLPK